MYCHTPNIALTHPKHPLAPFYTPKTHLSPEITHFEALYDHVPISYYVKLPGVTNLGGGLNTINTMHYTYKHENFTLAIDHHDCIGGT